jgi:hypothetical protein
VIAVVHLVWGPLGPAPLRDFLASYRAHPAGTEHELVVLLNGVAAAQRGELLAELEGTPHRVLDLADPVQDLAAYALAAARLEHDRLCFLNSHARILGPDWLAMLAGALDEPGVGLAGATGSWASMRSLALTMHFLPSPYRGAMPQRSVVLREFSSIERERDGGGDAPPAAAREPAGAPARGRGWLPRALWTTARSLPASTEQVLRFEGFPDQHLRSNGFIVERPLFAQLRTGTLRRKIDAYALESGRSSITRQVERRGLRALVVDRDGNHHEHPDWAATRTLWQGSQERLLIADNQTRMYANGSYDRRRMLSAMAWGQLAQPDPPAATPGPPPSSRAEPPPRAEPPSPRAEPPSPRAEPPSPRAEPPPPAAEVLR